MGIFRTLGSYIWQQSLLDDLKDYFPPRDPRTIGWFGSGDWVTFLIIIGCYIFIVGILLPSYMLTRRKFKIIGIVRLYNLALMGTNIFFFIELSKITYFGGQYDWKCQGIGSSWGSYAVVKLLHKFMFVRIFELIDTALFILRKKFKHASFRNISHHIIAVFIPWYGITYGADGQSCLMTLVNMAVHIIIYLYYFLSTYDSVKPKLTWKRYLTPLQILQFFVIITHMSIPIIQPCGFPVMNSVIVITAHLYFLIVFKAFYGSTYRSGDRRRKILGRLSRFMSRSSSSSPKAMS